MIEFACFVVLTALFVMFLRTLMQKWGILEWLQLNAPNEFMHKLFTCEFCQSFHLGMMVAIIITIVTFKWYMLFIPFFSSVIRW